MNHKKKNIICLLLLFSLPILLFGQKATEKEKLKRSRVGLAIGHAHIPSATKKGDDQGLVVVPSWGLSYSFRTSERFSIVLMSDFEMSNYVIENENKEELERENPISLALSFEYKIYKELAIFAGGGYEFEKEENLFIAIFGANYEIEIGELWDLTPEILYELKGGHTGAIIFALGVGVNF